MKWTTSGRRVNTKCGDLLAVWQPCAENLPPCSPSWERGMGDGVARGEDSR